MDFSQITVFVVGALLTLALLPAKWRGWALMVGSVLAIYWLQPRLSIRWLDYLLPSVTLALTIVLWMLTRAPEQKIRRADLAAFGITALIALVLTASRYHDFPLELTTRPPPTWYALIGLGVTILLIALIQWRGGKSALWVALLALIGLFIVIKAEPLARLVAAGLRDWTGQRTDLASAADLGWLGFSYVAFRLIHTVRDRQSGKLPEMNLRQYLTFVIFFPALTAGPIDRAERYLKDDAALETLPRFDPDRLARGTIRIAVGLFKKFVVADSLAVFSLSAVTAAQADSAGGLWLLLYAYSLRLFFDFSGYSDIAIGIGILYGVKLPENFNRPYLKSDITAFWQSWHITLSNWVRFYVFTPLSRTLLRRKWSQNAVIFSATMATMLIIGLWHGITLAFVIWGAWHGVGLFVHRLFSERTKKFYRGLGERPRLRGMLYALGVVATFHFVTLSWVWFALPDAAQAWDVFLRLWGVG